MLTLPLTIDITGSEINQAFHMFLSEYALGCAKGKSPVDAANEGLRVACATYDVQESHIMSVLADTRTGNIAIQIPFILDGNRQTTVIHWGTEHDRPKLPIVSKSL